MTRRLEPLIQCGPIRWLLPLAPPGFRHAMRRRELLIPLCGSAVVPGCQAKAEICATLFIMVALPSQDGSGLSKQPPAHPDIHLYV